MAADQANDWGKKWARIVARAWADEGFKKRLLADPAAVLKEARLQVPAGIRVRVVEDTDETLHLTLPQKPGEGELAEEDLQLLAAAANNCGEGRSTTCRGGGGA
jgi:hypothetical protein